MSPPQTTDVVRFADFEVDLASGELWRDGELVTLQEKPFQVLRALLDRPGAIVRREELHERLWGEDTFVDFDNNLNAAVKKLRDVLGDRAEDPRFVATVPRKGYRFVASVEPSSPVVVAAPRRWVRRPWAVAGFTLATLAALAVAAAFLETPRDAASPRGKIMLAVLPFENLDAEPERQYFADGLTEELITQLGRLEPARLGVIARTSAMVYQGSEKTVATIGRELGVGYVLEGSVRGGGLEDRLRVTAQLIAVEDQTHLWAETWDRDFADVLAVQSEIAVEVASALSLELLPGEPRIRARAATAATEAYRAYLQGRFEWNRFDRAGLLRAVEHYERALELDPRYGHAWAGLAEAHDLLAFQAGREHFPLALEAARRALELDPDLAAAHNALGFARLYHEWDFAAAEASFCRALELDPNFAMAHHWQAGLLAATGRTGAAIEAAHRALELDPASLSLRSDLGWYYLFADRFAAGLEVCRETLAVNPHYGWARSCLVEARLALGDLAKAAALIGERHGAGEVASEDPARFLERHWERQLAEELAAATEGRGHALSIAFTASRLGRFDLAFHWLDRAHEERDPWLVFLLVHPVFDPLHGDARMRAFAEQVGLVDPA